MRGNTFDSIHEADVYTKLCNSASFQDVSLQAKVLIYPKLEPYPNKYWKIDFSCLTSEGLVWVEAKLVFDAKAINDAFMLRQNNPDVWRALIYVASRATIKKQAAAIKRLKRPVIAIESFASDMASIQSELKPFTPAQRSLCL